MNIAFHNVSSFKVGKQRSFVSIGSGEVYTVALVIEYEDNYGNHCTQEINFYSDAPVFEENTSE